VAAAAAFYLMIGVIKLIVIMLNLVPYIVFVIMS